MGTVGCKAAFRILTKKGFFKFFYLPTYGVEYGSCEGTNVKIIWEGSNEVTVKRILVDTIRNVKFNAVDEILFV